MGLSTPEIDAVRSGSYAYGAPTGHLPSYVSSRSRDKSTLGARDKAPERIEAGRCVSPARGIRWLMPDDTLEPVRCGASNRCDYCAMFAALEAALVLKLDAHVRQPTVGITTTTRRQEGYSMKDFQKAEQSLWRQLRKDLEPKGVPRAQVAREERIEYCGFIEFTTGEGARAGGLRMPHQHALTKGIPATSGLLELFPFSEVDSGHPVMQKFANLPPAERAEALRTAKTCRLELRVAELWWKYTGDSFIVDARPLRTPAGAIAYLTLHHHKKNQAPPANFKGRRLRPSKGYYEQPIAELRQLAQKLAAHERVVIAVKRAIAFELFHETEDEIAADEALTAALVRGLRSIASDPLELQLDLEGEFADPTAERRELVIRTAAELKRIRDSNPPELVRVRERVEIDEDGAMIRRATAVLGPLDTSPRGAVRSVRGREPALGCAA
jgi:hypothetical protein